MILNNKLINNKHKYICKNKLILLIIIFILLLLIIKFQIIIHKSNIPILLFIEKCYNDILINKSLYLTSQLPKISVIIPIYNAEKYIHYSLRSVQNQKMKEIEIIIIDDNSNDDSIKIVQKYMEEDKRIKLIENKNNRQILFSKSIGALNSKGKYIIELDQDDMFIRDDAFDIIYNESEKNDLDYLSFKYISAKNVFKEAKFINNFIKDKNIIIKQPYLKYSMFKTNNCLLWGHLIRADLYKKVIYHLWPIIINYKIIFQEDFLITFFILIFAERFKKIEKNIFFHFHNRESASKDYENNYDYFLSVIFAGNIFYDYYFDSFPEDIEIIMNYIGYISKHLKKAKKLYSSFFNYLFGKILSNFYLPLKNKIYIEKIFKISRCFDTSEKLNINQELIFEGPQTIKNRINNKPIKLSIIIVCSNNENLKNIINLIRTQNFEYFEIILIFDNDNEIIDNILVNYNKSFENIKLIKNERKKGKLYSIIKGIAFVKGKYFLILDKNCFFLNNNALNNIYEEIEKEDFDVIEFNLYKIAQNNHTILYKCHHYSTEFNYSHIKYNLRFEDIDISKELLTNKLIKSDYFRKISKKYNLKGTEIIIDKFYNEILSFIINSNEHDFKRLNSTNIYMNEKYFEKIKFNDFINSNKEFINETIFYINFIFDNSKNTYEDKEIILQDFFKLLSVIFNKFTNVSQSSIELLNKFLDCKYISEQNKNLLKFYYNSLLC